MQENIVTIKRLCVNSHFMKDSLYTGILDTIREIIDCLDVTELEDLVYMLNSDVEYGEDITDLNESQNVKILYDNQEIIEKFISKNKTIIKELLDSRKRLLENDLRTELLKIIKEKHIMDFHILIDYLENIKNKKHEKIIVLDNSKDKKEVISKDNSYEYSLAEYFLVRHYERLITYVVKENIFFINYLNSFKQQFKKNTSMTSN